MLHANHSFITYVCIYIYSVHLLVSPLDRASLPLAFSWYENLPNFLIL